MVALVSIIIILASILLIAVVFVQNPKGGGLSSDFGSAQQLGGVQRSNEFIEKATWTLAVVIMLSSFLLTSLMSPDVPVAPQAQEATQQQGQQQQSPSQGQPAAPAQ